MAEPILLGLAPALITGLIAALANVLRSFGVADITQAQIDAVNQAAVAIMLVLAGVGAWWARRHATPVARPSLPEGTAVRLPDGTAGTVRAE